MDNEIRKMLGTFLKENKRLVRTIRAFEQLNQQEQELQRESLSTNLQLGFQIYETLIASLYKDTDSFRILERDFQLACRVLEDHVELLLVKQREDHRIQRRFFEQVPLLNEIGNLEEVKEPSTISIERSSQQLTKLQEALKSLMEIQRTSQELTSIALNKPLDRHESINKGKAKEKANRSFHIKYICVMK